MCNLRMSASQAKGLHMDTQHGIYIYTPIYKLLFTHMYTFSSVSMPPSQLVFPLIFDVAASGNPHLIQRTKELGNTNKNQGYSKNIATNISTYIYKYI